MVEILPEPEFQNPQGLTDVSSFFQFVNFWSVVILEFLVLFEEKAGREIDYFGVVHIKLRFNFYM